MTICLKLPFRVLYGGITISSANQTVINVPPANVQKRKRVQNVTETLKKLKKMQTGNLTISKTIVPNPKPVRKCRFKPKFYGDDDEEIEDECEKFDDEDSDPNFDGCAADERMSSCKDVSDDEDYKASNKQSKNIKKNSTQNEKKHVISKTNETNSNSISIKINAPPVYLCMKCKNRFQSLEELKEHVFQKNECTKSQLNCKICDKTFDTKKKLSQHVKTHQEKTKFICDKCGKIYSNQFNLENHKSSQHGEYFEEFQNIYKCRLCNDKYNNRTDLYLHMKSHSTDCQPLLCDTCGKCFSSNHALRTHMRNHLDIRPHACSFCPKRFRTRLLLKQHLHVHTGIKEFQCTLCEQQFAKRDSLRIHLRKRHPDYQPASKESKPVITSSNVPEAVVATVTNGEAQTTTSEDIK